MAKKTLYSRDGKEFNDPDRVVILYRVTNGEVIEYVEGRDLPISTGEQTKIDAGEWAILDLDMSAEDFAELTARNIMIQNNKPTRIGPKNWTPNKPPVVDGGEIL